MNTSTDSDTLLDEEPVFPENENNQRRALDLLAHAPCPVRNEMRRRLHKHFRAVAQSGGAVPAWFMPAG